MCPQIRNVIINVPFEKTVFSGSHLSIADITKIFHCNYYCNVFLWGPLNYTCPKSAKRRVKCGSADFFAGLGRDRSGPVVDQTSRELGTGPVLTLLLTYTKYSKYSK